MFITYGKNFLATIFLYLICNNILFAQLSGPMTIDPSLPASATNFTSITAAVLALQSQGISAAVQFSIASGTYTEQITIGAITGASATHTITFQSATSQAADVIWQFSAVSVSSNFVLKLDDADHLIFSAITFRAQGSSYARAVQLINGANENTFESCRLEGQVPTWTSNDAFAVLYVNQFGGNSPSNNSFRQNTFQSGSWGAYFRDQSGSTKITGTLLEDNLFLNQVWTGVYFFQTNGNQILSNRFESADITYGMFISGVNAVDWQINRNLFLLSNPGATVTGMRLSTGSTTSQVEVHNNVIHLNNQTGTGSTFGIRIENCKNLQIYYNTIKVEGASTNAASSAAIYDFSTLINPNANPQQKYKALGGTKTSGLIAYVSADGIHWEPLQKEAVFSQGIFDSQNVSFWSEAEQSYLCYFRTWTGEGYQGFRSVSRTTSKDFIHWSDPVPMSFGDTPYEHIYTQQTHPYYRAPHMYLAIGARFMKGRQVVNDEQAKSLDVNPRYYKDCSDAFLMSSRGGSNYDRTFMESFIRPGIGLENWVSRSNYPALNVVQTGPTEMSLYVNEHYAQPTAHLKRYSMRIDGFASLSADYQGGEMTTKAFTFTGDQLEINYATSAAGGIRIEIQDEQGKAIPAYSLNEAQEIIGNEISRIVLWNGQSDISSLANKPIRLRFVMKDADVYSFRFFAN